MQEKSDSYTHFSDRLNRLLDDSGWSVSEFCRRAKLSRQTIHAIGEKQQPITAKTWLKLRNAEQAALPPGKSTENQSDPMAQRPRGGVPSAKPRPGPGMIHEVDQSPYGNPATAGKFAEYLVFIRGCREEAERISGGDLVKGQEIFDRLLAGGLTATDKKE